MGEELFYDIVVIGGGLSGTCAAIAAARECRRLKNLKFKVALIQDRPVLGGCSSSEIRVPPIGAGRHVWGYETGIIHEMMLEERKRNHIQWDNGTVNSIWDLILWETVKKEENLELFLNTTVYGVDTWQSEKSEKNYTIKAVDAIQAGTGKFFRISGKIFIDATGDATVGALAGAEYRMGREASEEFDEKFAPEKADDNCMGSSLQFQAKDMGYPVPFTPPPYAALYPDDECLCSRPHEDFRNGYWWIEVGTPYNTISDNEKIRDELIRHVLGVWDHIKNHCPKFKEKSANWVLEWFGWFPGKRESRRLMGDFILSEKDLKSARVFEDRVAYGGHFLDLHSIGGILAKGEPGNPVDTDPALYDDMRVIPYSIPLRSLYSRNISNLMMAGRNISATHVALGSTRVMLTNAVIGQGVGTVAVYAATKEITPRECKCMYINDIQQSLLRQGCYLPFMANNDPGDLALKASVSASSEMALDMAPITDSSGKLLYPDNRQSMKDPLGVLFPVTEKRIKHIWLWLESDAQEPVIVKAGLRKAKHVWDFSSVEDIGIAQALVHPGECGWVRFDFNVPADPGGLYWVYKESTGSNELFWHYELDIATGTVSVWKRIVNDFWYYISEGYRKCFRMLCMKIDPVSMPYSPQNVTNGVTRPEKWTNMWISDPKKGLPQYIDLKWDTAMEFNKVEIVFDTDLSLTNESTPPLTKQPKCARDYKLLALCDGAWIELHMEEGNYQRKRIHEFDTVIATAVRLEIAATNGDPSARVYEMRVYNE